MAKKAAPKPRGQTRQPAHLRKYPVNIGLTSVDLDQIDGMADELGISRSEMIRRIITRSLARQRKKAAQP